MREVVIAANWKMHTTPADAGELARTIASRTREAGVTRVICPPFVCLGAVRDALADADPDVGVGHGRGIETRGVASCPYGPHGFVGDHEAGVTRAAGLDTLQ